MNTVHVVVVCDFPHYADKVLLDLRQTGIQIQFLTHELGLAMVIFHEPIGMRHVHLTWGWLVLGRVVVDFINGNPGMHLYPRRMSLLHDIRQGIVPRLNIGGHR